MSVEHIRTLINELDSPLCAASDHSHVMPAAGGCFVCHERTQKAVIERTGNKMLRFDSIFIVCNSCGNKRCPHASWHGYQCTASNDPNQKRVGSPPPEAALAQSGITYIRELLAELEGK